jgi:predicted nucleic-acid-binding protein
MKETEDKIIDANIILRYLLKDDEGQFKIADSFFVGVKAGKRKAVILESVLMEVFYVLSKVYDIPKSEIINVLKNLLSFKGVKDGSTDSFIHALDCHGSHSCLSLVDCLICIKSKKLKIGILSFDKKLNNNCK